MPDQDYTVLYQDLNCTIKCVSASTQHPALNSAYEAHPHSQEFEIYLFLKGDLCFFFEGKRFDIQEGDMVLLCNGLLHRPILRSSCHYYRKRILFDKKIFTRLNSMDFDLYNRLRKRGMILLHAEYVTTSGIDQLFEEIARSLSCHSPYEDFCALINLFTLLIKAEKGAGAAEIAEESSHVWNGKANEIIEYIDSHLAEDLSYQALSDCFFMSQKNLYKFFKKETGFSLGSYINQRRIIKAQTLLSSGKNAADAASAAGFKDYSSFYRSFLRVTGITPTEYVKTLDTALYL